MILLHNRYSKEPKIKDKFEVTKLEPLKLLLISFFINIHTIKISSPNGFYIYRFNNRFDEKIKLSLNDLKRDFRTKMINSLMSLLIGCSFAILFRIEMITWRKKFFPTITFKPKFIEIFYEIFSCFYYSFI